MVDSTLAQLSDTLFWVALVLYAISLIAFIVAFAYRAKGASTAGVIVAAGGTVAVFHLGMDVTIPATATGSIQTPAYTITTTNN